LSNSNFIIKRNLLIKQHYSALKSLQTTLIDQTSLGVFELDNIPLIPLLFQAGYLTISDYQEKTGKFKLDFPNFEVELSLTRFLVTTLAQTSRIELDTLNLNNFLQ
jgi:hypothetical protein